MLARGTRSLASTAASPAAVRRLPLDIASVYDMDVWPGFQRQGLGRALLRTVCASARVAGARAAVLNATPDGEQLYSAEGFVRIGTGITYWHHLG